MDWENKICSVLPRLLLYAASALLICAAVNEFFHKLSLFSSSDMYNLRQSETSPILSFDPTSSTLGEQTKTFHSSLITYSKKFAMNYRPSSDYGDPCDILRQDCCADSSYPVLGGVDVVHFKLTGKIVFGDPSIFSYVNGISKQYKFWFSQKSYSTLFESNPEAYLPMFGGFDAENFCNTEQNLKILISKTVDIGAAQENHHRIIFGNPLDLNTCEKAFDSYYGRAVNSIFNTRCVSMKSLGVVAGLFEGAPQPIKMSELYGVSPLPLTQQSETLLPLAIAENIHFQDFFQIDVIPADNTGQVIMNDINSRSIANSDEYETHTSSTYEISNGVDGIYEKFEGKVENSTAVVTSTSEDNGLNSLTTNATTKTAEPLQPGLSEPTEDSFVLPRTSFTHSFAYFPSNLPGKTHSDVSPSSNSKDISLEYKPYVTFKIGGKTVVEWKEDAQEMAQVQSSFPLDHERSVTVPSLGKQSETETSATSNQSPFVSDQASRYFEFKEQDKGVNSRTALVSTLLGTDAVMSSQAVPQLDKKEVLFKSPASPESSVVLISSLNFEMNPSEVNREISEKVTDNFSKMNKLYFDEKATTDHEPKAQEKVEQDSSEILNKENQQKGNIEGAYTSREEQTNEAQGNARAGAKAKVAQDGGDKMNVEEQEVEVAQNEVNTIIDKYAAIEDQNKANEEKTEPKGNVEESQPKVEKAYTSQEQQIKEERIEGEKVAESGDNENDQDVQEEFEEEISFNENEFVEQVHALSALVKKINSNLNPDILIHH